MRASLSFKWYDLWIGLYFDRKGGVYICPLPCVVIELRRGARP